MGKKFPIALVLRLETLALINGKGSAIIAESAFPGWIPDFGANPANFKNLPTSHDQSLNRAPRGIYGEEIKKWDDECLWLLARSVRAQLRSEEKANPEAGKSFMLEAQRTKDSEMDTHVEAAEGNMLPLMYCVSVDDRTWAVLPRLTPELHQSFKDEARARVWCLGFLKTAASFLQEELAEKGLGLDLERDWRAFFETSTTQAPLFSGRFFSPMAGYPAASRQGWDRWVQSASSIMEAQSLRESVKEGKALPPKTRSL